MRLLSFGLAAVLGLTISGAVTTTASAVDETHEVYGNVYDFDTNVGMAGATVAVYGGADLTEKLATMTTKPDGYGSWSIDLPDGVYGYVLTNEGYSTISETFEVKGELVYVGSDYMQRARGGVSARVSLEFAGAAKCAYVTAYRAEDGGAAFGTYGNRTGDLVEFTLPVDDYRFRVGDECSGYPAQWIGAGARSFDTAETKQVEEGVQLNLGTTIIDEGSLIVGRVTEAGEPSVKLRYVEVEVTPVDQTEGGFTGHARTGATGTFTISGAPDGDYDIRAFDSLGDYTSSEPARITVDGGKVTQNFELQKSPPVTDLALLKGKVTTSKSIGLADVKVEAYTATSDLKPVYSTRTRRDGSYSMAGLVQGTYKLRFVAPTDGVAVGDGYVSEWFDNRASFRSAVPVVFTDRTVTANVVLTKLGSLSGRVTLPSTAKPQRDVHLSLYDVDGEIIDRTSAANDGTYTFLGVTPGVYKVRSDATTYDGSNPDAGYVSYIRQYYTQKYAVTTATTVKVVDALDTTGINFTMSDKLSAVTVPKVTGTAKKGKKLTSSTGSWSLMANTELEYQWYRGSAKIAGATKNAYTAAKADIGKKLKVVVTASDEDGRYQVGTASSAVTKAVAK